MALAVELDAGEIDSLFRPLDQCRLPGAAVGIALHGKPLYRRAFGLAHMELPVALSPTMRMRIGSTTKHFASLAYLLLCEERRASLDDPVGKHLPELHVSAGSVTVRQIMGHVSGLRDTHEIAWLFNGTAAMSSQDLLDLYRRMDDVNSEPGTAWSYNNGGYLILSGIVERIIGEPLEEVLKARIFQPVGMHDTLLRRRDTDFLPNSATLHALSAGGGFRKCHLGTDLSGEGGMVSTVDDMLAWLAHMDEPCVGNTETWAMLTQPQQLVNGTATGYGLGLIVNEYRGVSMVSHGGGVLGGNSQMLKVPSAGLDVVVMLNRDDVSAVRLAYGIVDASLPGLPGLPARVNCGPWPCSEGVFRSPATGRVIELLERDGQQIVAIDGYDWPFVAARQGVLEPDSIWSHLKMRVLLIGHPGRPTSLVFEDFGNADELHRLERGSGQAQDLPVGTYSSPSTGTAAVIQINGAGATLTAKGRFGSHTYTLDYLAPDLWRARSGCAIPWDAVLFFPPGGRELHLNALRTRNLRFVRQPGRAAQPLQCMAAGVDESGLENR